MPTQYMNFVDVIILLLFIALIFRGAYTGFISQMSFFIGLFLGVSVASQTYLLLAQRIQAHFESFSTASVVSYGIIFFLVFVATGFLGKYLRNLFSMKMAPWLDHMVGGVLGFFIAVIVCAFLIMIANRVDDLRAPIQNSAFMPYVNKSAKIISSLLPSFASQEQ